MLTTVKGQDVTPGAVTVIVSGNRPKEIMQTQDERYAFYDGRLSDLGSGDPDSLIPLISDNWTTHFTWDGTGKVP